MGYILFQLLFINCWMNKRYILPTNGENQLLVTDLLVEVYIYIYVFIYLYDLVRNLGNTYLCAHTLCQESTFLYIKYGSLFLI